MNSTSKIFSPDQNDYLLKALFELAKELSKFNIPLIIGGGLSLYLRTIYSSKVRSPRYPKRTEQRVTKDIDIFLSSDIIVDSAKVQHIRDSLAKLNYLPRTKYFQFYKEIDLNYSKREILIDILSAPPDENKKENISIKKPRIKHNDVKNFHAYLVNEALGINYNPIKVDELSKTSNESVNNLYIISSFNYIILKLHAFEDRKVDATVDFGRHHAYDIFATICDMDEVDWENAKNHFNDERNKNYIQESILIIKTYFSSSTDLGIIRLKENELYKKYKVEFDNYIEFFIEDLKTLFMIED